MTEKLEGSKVARVKAEELAERVWRILPTYGHTDYEIFAASEALNELVRRAGGEESGEEATVRHALEVLLTWAERARGGDPSLDPEEWYIARDYARIALAAPPSPEQEQL